jgi:hypothetical protein
MYKEDRDFFSGSNIEFLEILYGDILALKCGPESHLL